MRATMGGGFLVRRWLDRYAKPHQVAVFVANVARTNAARAAPLTRWEGEGGRLEPVREPRPDPVLVLAGINPGAAGAATAGE